MYTADEIHGLFSQRESRLAGRFARMRDVSDVYNGRTELHLPELSKREKAAVPNLVQQGTDQIARRAVSVMPNLTYPSTKPGKKAADDRADQRRMANYGWWALSNIRKVQSRRARWLITYASAPVLVRPDIKLGCPRWEPVDPFDVFPSPTSIDSFTPEEVIVRHRRTLQWLRAQYPDAMIRVEKGDNPKGDDEFDVLQSITPEAIQFVVVGKKNSYYHSQGHEPCVELGPPVPNASGVCWLVNPQRVSLDAPVGHFDEILGMYQTQAEMMALQIIASRRAIWPRTWFVNPNTGAQPTMQQKPDPETGEPGILVNGIIDREQIDPSFQAQAVIDHIEASARQTAALPAELGGSGSQNVRTGRRGSQVMSASIDFTIAEIQDALAEGLHEENLRAIAIEKAYFNKQKTMYVSWKGARGQVDYKPSDIFGETSEHIVEYPIAGTDLSDLVINGGQRVAQGTMSKRSFMEIDPLVSDAEAEEQRVRFEGMEQAFLVSVQTLASQPDGPMQLPDLQRIAEKMFAGGMSWWEAVAELQKEKQREQAEGAERGAPEAQPGLAMPGQGAEIPIVGEPGPDMGHMTQILNQLGSADTALAMR